MLRLMFGLASLHSRSCAPFNVTCLQGGPAATSRGEMIHLVLTLCRKFETAFAKLIDGGKGGAS